MDVWVELIVVLRLKVVVMEAEKFDEVEIEEELRIFSLLSCEE